MSLPREIEARLAQMVDREMFETDARYHADVSRLRSLLHLVQMALEDEGVERGIVQGVLNRIVYGTPNGADAYERIENFQATYQRLSEGPSQQLSDVYP